MSAAASADGMGGVLGLGMTNLDGSIDPGLEEHLRAGGEGTHFAWDFNVEQRYCPRCHWWTGDPIRGPGHLADDCPHRKDRDDKGSM